MSTKTSYQYGLPFCAMMPVGEFNYRAQFWLVPEDLPNPLEKGREYALQLSQHTSSAKDHHFLSLVLKDMGKASAKEDEFGELEESFLAELSELICLGLEVKQGCAQ